MDSQIHTVTSGNDANDLQSGRVFDSKAHSAIHIMNYNSNTKSTFLLRQFHPQRIRKVIVS